MNAIVAVPSAGLVKVPDDRCDAGVDFNVIRLWACTVLGRFVEHCCNVGCVVSMTLERHKDCIRVIPVAIQILTALDPMPSVG